MAEFLNSDPMIMTVIMTDSGLMRGVFFVFFCTLVLHLLLQNSYNEMDAVSRCAFLTHDVELINAWVFS